MELVYISRAIRRYWWITAACVLAGVVAGLVVAPARNQVYETEAWIQISPPAQAFGATATDRDVQNHLVALGSESLAAQVAERIDGIDGDAVREATTFEQVPGSDIIRVIASFGDAEVAQAVANGYVDDYLEMTRAQRAEGRTPDLEAIESNIAVLEDSLADVNSRIDEVLRPYIERADLGGSTALPTIDQVAPGLAAERETIRTEYTELVRIRTELLVTGARSDLGTRAVQRAPLPETARAQGMSLLMLALPFGGLVLGGLLSVALARISPRVLDAEEITEALGVPIASSLPRHRSRSTLPELLAAPVPPTLAPSIHELCVRAEASAEIDSTLTVVVAGADHRSGATTVAVAMASHFADAGATVLLLDVDVRTPDLSDALAEDRSGLAQMLADEVPPAGTGKGRHPRSEASVTVEPGIAFAGLGPQGARHRLLRGDAHELVERARGHAQVVVIDAGMLMDAASSVELARLADAVVLCIPHRRQRSNLLEAVGQQLTGISGVLLPVLIPASADRRRSSRTDDDRQPDAPEAGESVDAGSADADPVDGDSTVRSSKGATSSVSSATRASRGSRGSASRSPAT